MPPRTIAALICCFLLATAAGAVEPDEMLDDPRDEQRAREISQQLRCLVCDNETIDDSNADLARDLRILVRERIQAGESDREVINYIVDRYGAYVLLRPPFNAQTWALWLAPALLLLGGAVVAVWMLQRNRPDRSAAPDDLSPAERRKLDQILQQKTRES